MVCALSGLLLFSFSEFSLAVASVLNSIYFGCDVTYMYKGKLWPDIESLDDPIAKGVH